METELSYHPIKEDEKQAICEWVYDGEYSIYNLPSYEEMKEKNLGFANPQKEKNFYTYFDNDTLVGFTNILEEETEVFIGIGVNPDFCSKGYGQKILESHPKSAHKNIRENLCIWKSGHGMNGQSGATRKRVL